MKRQQEDYPAFENVKQRLDGLGPKSAQTHVDANDESLLRQYNYNHKSLLTIMSRQNVFRQAIRNRIYEAHRKCLKEVKKGRLYEKR